MTQFKGQKPLKDDDVRDAPAGQQASVGIDADPTRPHACPGSGWRMTYAYVGVTTVGAGVNSLCFKFVTYIDCRRSVDRIYQGSESAVG